MRYEERHVAKKQYALLSGFPMQVIPLAEEDILFEAVILEILAVLSVEAGQYRRVSPGKFFRPLPPGTHFMRLFDHGIQGIIVQPMALLRSEVLITELISLCCRPHESLSCGGNTVDDREVPAVGVYFLIQPTTHDQIMQADKTSISGVYRSGLVGRTVIIDGIDREHLPDTETRCRKKIDEAQSLVSQGAFLLPVGQGTGVQEDSCPALTEDPVHTAVSIPRCSAGSSEGITEEPGTHRVLPAGASVVIVHVSDAIVSTGTDHATQFRRTCTLGQRLRQGMRG